MKTKIKRHSRSVLSVVLALCMLLSCMTAGMIMTDAAKVDSESVSWNPATDKFSYKVGSGEWTDLSFNSNGVTTFTVSNDNSTLEFKLVFNGTVYNHDSSQSTFSADGMHSKDGETRLAKIGGSDYSVSGVYADTYTVKLTTTVNNGEVNFKINGTFVEPASSWTVVGDSEELFGGTWNTTNTANGLDMTKTPYEWTKNAVYLSAGDIEYKVVKNHAWAGCYPAAGNRKTTVSSSGYYNVTVTYDGKTDLKMTLAPAAKCTLTVPQIADATVTATYGSQTAAEGQSLTNVPAGADVSVTVIPDSGHKCTGVSGETLSAGSSTATGSGTNWTLKMPNSDAMLAATIVAYQAQMRRIYFYNKYTQYPMVSIYAYYKTGDTITDEIFGSGTTMTKMANSDLWYIDVPEDAYVRFMGEGYSTGELTQNSTKPKYIPGTNRKDPGNGGYWGEYIERNNVYSVNEGDNMSSSNLFTGITATFFDYYVDNEVTGGWLTGITAESDYKCSGYTNDPYRTYLNAALSNYADNTNEPKNNITYPLYWGNNKNINGDDIDAPANVHPGDLFNFYLSVNNSAKLNPPSTAMQGLAGNTLAGGNIHHYKADAADNNGAAMAFFDEDFLSGENSQSKALATILHSPKFPVRKDAASKTLYLDTSANTGWENDNAVMRAVFFNSATDEAGRHIVQAAKVADHLYAVAVPSDYAKVQWWRGDPNDVGTRWNYGNDVSIPTDNKIVCKIKDGEFNNNDEWVASSSTTTTHTYYEYDSTNGKDNAYITDINTTEKTANLSYYDQASGKHVQSQNNLKGFFPFDYNNIIAAATYPTDTIYVDVSNNSGGASYWAYFYNSTSDNTTVKMTPVSGNNYTVSNPGNYSHVIFTKSDTQDFKWTTKTQDLDVPNGSNNKTSYRYYNNGGNDAWYETAGLQPIASNTNNFADPTGRLAHDQGFGMKLEIPFTLNKYGVNKDGSPQTFDFSGDDDLWVYIDDKLVLDLGGAHGRTTGTINFNSMQAVADTAAAVTTGTDQVNGGIRSYDFSGIINTAANDFNHNQIHTMTIYYMERGMFDSNLRFGFSFSAVDTLFSAEKKIRTRSLNSGFFVDNGLTDDESNMSDLKLDKGVRQVTEFEKSFQSDQFDITQTYVDPLPDDHTDITYSIGAVSTTISNASGRISYTLQNTDQTEKRAYFNGQFASGDTFTMKETAKVGNKYNYTPSIIVYDEAKKLSNGNPTPFATVANATSGGQVSGNNTDGYKFLFQPINEPVAGGLEDLRIRARFENDMKQHALTIKKTVSDPNDTTTAFNFKIQFDFTDDNVDNYVGYPLVINGHSDTTLSPEGRVTIKAGQSITLYGIPEKAKVQVTEVTPNAPYVYDSTTVKTDGGDDVEKTPVKTPVVSGVRFVMGTANTIVTTKNSKGEPVHITHTLHPDSTGQADCYVSATVQNASGVVQNDGTFEQTDAMITVPASFINYTSNNKLVIVLNTVPEDHSNFTNFYEKITDEMKPLAASGIPYSAEIDLPNRTATITIAIKDLFDQTTHKQLYKTLPFYSKLDLIADNFTISKQILDGMDSTETYNINIKTKATFTTSGTATPYKGPYVIKHTDGTTDSVASDDTRTECQVTLHPNEEIKIGVVNETIFEITEEALSSTYQRKFHYVSSTVDGTTFNTDTADTANVKKVTNGVLVKVTSDNKKVDINNKAWGYMIEYTYPGYLKRYGVKPGENQKYYVSGLFSEADYVDKVELAEVQDHSNGNELVQGVKFKNDDIQKNFITSHAPYEDNFMTDLTWNPIFDGTGANTTRFFYANDIGTEVNMKPNVVATENKHCKVYFQIPFAYTASTENGFVPTPSSDDGGKVLMIAPKQMDVQAPYGKWYTMNNKYTEAEAKFVTAPREIYKKKGENDYEKYVFLYWSMKTTPTGHDRRTTEEYKRCYYWDFNMTFYQDTIVEPVYALAGEEGTNLTPAQLEASDTANGNGTNITFLENSRNQWNRDGGYNQEDPSREHQGDRVYSDFLLSFSYNDDMLRNALSKKITETVGEGEDAEEVTYYAPYKVGGNELHYSGGLVIERVVCDDITSTSNIKTQDQYRALYGEGEGEGDNLVAAATDFINSGKRNEGNFLLNETFSAAGFDNKNQFEYSTSFANKRHTDLSIDTPYKGYVYRAYTYLRDYDGSAATTGNCMVNGSPASTAEVNKIKNHNGSLLAVSKPVYFTIYEMATIENGIPYTGQGES